MNDRNPVTDGRRAGLGALGPLPSPHVGSIHSVVVMGPPLPIQRVGGDERSSGARLLRSLEDLSPPLLVTESRAVIQPSTSRPLRGDCGGGRGTVSRAW